MTEQERVNFRRIRQNIITRLDGIESELAKVYDDAMITIQDAAKDVGEDIVFSYNISMSNEQKAREIKSVMNQIDNPKVEKKIKDALKKGKAQRSEKIANIQKKMYNIYQDQLTQITDELKSIEQGKKKFDADIKRLKQEAIKLTNKMKEIEAKIKSNSDKMNEISDEFYSKYNVYPNEYEELVKNIENEIAEQYKKIEQYKNDDVLSDEAKNEAIQKINVNINALKDKKDYVMKTADSWRSIGEENSRLEEQSKGIDAEYLEKERAVVVIKAQKGILDNAQASLAHEEYKEDLENLKEVLNKRDLKFDPSGYNDIEDTEKKDEENKGKEENKSDEKSKGKEKQQNVQGGVSSGVVAPVANPQQQATASVQQPLTPNDTSAAKNIIDKYNESSPEEIADNLDNLDNLTAFATALQKAQNDKNSNIDKQTLKDFKGKFSSGKASIVGRLSQDLYDSYKYGDDFTKKVVDLMSKLDGREKEDIEELVNSMYEGYNKFEGEDEKDKKRKFGKRKKENEADTRKEDVYGCVTPLLQGSLDKKEAQELSSIVTELSAKNDLSEEELETFEILKKQILVGYVYKTVDVMNRTPMSKFFNKINGSNKACIALAKNVTDIQNKEVSRREEESKSKFNNDLEKMVNDPSMILGRNRDAEPVRKQQPPTR